MITPREIILLGFLLLLLVFLAIAILRVRKLYKESQEVQGKKGE